MRDRGKRGLIVDDFSLQGLLLNRERKGNQPRETWWVVMVEAVGEGGEGICSRLVEENQGIMDCSVLVVEMVGEGIAGKKT